MLQTHILADPEIRDSYTPDLQFEDQQLPSSDQTVFFFFTFIDLLQLFRCDSVLHIVFLISVVQPKSP